MSALTAKELSAIADDFSKLAAEISNYIVQRRLSIRGRLGKVHFAILEEAEKLYTLSAMEVGVEAQKAVNQLSDITTKILESYQYLHDIKQAMNLAVAALEVLTALTGKNIPALIAAVKTLGKKADMPLMDEDE